MFDEEVEINSNYVNAKIKAHILSDEKMKEIGFTDYSKTTWFFCRSIKFPKEVRYRGFDISFNVSIPKDGSDIRIDVLDEDFCQPYDYQSMLHRNPTFKPALIVLDQVEEHMEYLQSKGVLSGHVKGEYI
jgi:hypothetical protein